MTEKEIKKELQKTLYFKKIENSEEFLNRFSKYLLSYVRETNKLPGSLKIAKLMTKIIKDIKDKDLSNIRHKVLKKNRHDCFRYFFEDIVELIELDWKAYKIQKFLSNKKKCKAPARATITRFIADYQEEKKDNG
jgi:hypothetical protein